MLLWDRQVVGLQSFHVGLNGFLNIRQGGFLGLSLAHAAGQSGALGHPEAVFSPIDQHLTHIFIVRDFAEESDVTTGCAGVSPEDGSTTHSTGDVSRLFAFGTHSFEVTEETRAILEQLRVVVRAPAVSASP